MADTKLVNGFGDDESFAVYKDLKLRWKDVPDDVDYVNMRLYDASTFIREQCRSWRSVGAATLIRIACELARESLSAEAQSTGLGFDVMGASQMSMTAGPYNQQVSFANPSGRFYLTAAQKTSLGMKRQQVWSIPQSSALAEADQAASGGE